MLKHKT